MMKEGLHSRRRGLTVRRFASRGSKGFTMFEILLVIVALGLLAALVVPTVDRFFDATSDTAKAHNAQMLNRYAETLFNAGVDTSTWKDSTSAIALLTAGVDIPATVPKGVTQQVKLKQEINPAAYKFTPGDTTKPPVFEAILGVRAQRP